MKRAFNEHDLFLLSSMVIKDQTFSISTINKEKIWVVMYKQPIQLDYLECYAYDEHCTDHIRKLFQRNIFTLNIQPLNYTKHALLRQVTTSLFTSFFFITSGS